MLTENRVGCEAAVSRALAGSATMVKSTGGGRWDLRFVNGRTFAATARIEKDWFLLESNFGAEAKPGPALPELWKLLRRNRRLAPGVKFVLPPGRSSSVLRIELPLDGDPDGLVRRACQGWLRAMSLAAPEPGPRHRHAPEPRWSEPMPEASNRNLDALCREAGWPGVERSGQFVAVDLDVPGQFVQAQVAADVRGWVAGVEVVATERSPVVCAAVGHLLLTVGALVRLIRPVCDGTAAGLEVLFDHRPSAAQLHEALSGLSVGARLCAREAALLADENLARKYLAAWGCSPQP